MQNITEQTFKKVFFITLIFLTAFFLFFYKIQLAGDIPEYYGITQSLISHGGVNLTLEDKQKLSEQLNPGYFELPGYYIVGRNGNRYPVHFIFYSFLLLPIRLILEFLSANPIRSFSIVNTLILMSTIFVISRFFVKDNQKRLLLLALTIFSPIMFFLSWPGPDVYYIALLLLSIYLYFSKKLFLATLLAIFASWHSQPLIIIAFYFGLRFVLEQAKSIGTKLVFNKQFVLQSLLLGVLVLFPYLYNLYAFGVLTPWTVIQDGWTVLYGFGLHNASLKKLFEQFFELNMGLFWYAPFLVILGFWFGLKNLIKNKEYLYILLIFLATAFFYQTNPAWHYGTAGFGPSRHIIFFIPLLIYLVVDNFRFNFSKLFNVMISGLFIVQLFVLSLNSFLSPNFTNTLQNSPFSKIVLNNTPVLYNPTSEIFVDRTNHADLGYVSSAIYKNSNGECRKAYILKHDREFLLKECGDIPSSLERFFDDPLKKPSDVVRTIYTIKAYFWPIAGICNKDEQLDTNICIRSFDQLVKETGLKVNNNFSVMPFGNYDGVWQVESETPFKITIPVGYFVDAYSFEGVYVNY
jgi:hypothetical protein